MKLRDYVAADRDACLAVFDSNVPRFFRPHERPGLCEFLDALPGPYYVLEDDDGTILGCGGWAMEPDGRTGALCWGMVRQDLHGRGLGKRLALERLRRMRDDPRVRAISMHTSQHTRGFYEALGFTVRRIERDGYAPGLDRVDLRFGPTD